MEFLNIKEYLKEIINTQLKALGVNAEVEYTIEIPKDKNHGDYSTNVAMKLARELKKSPRDIAVLFVEGIEQNDIIKGMSIAGPGFINFVLDKTYLLDVINVVINKGNLYGSTTKNNPQKINVEFVSANPTGILHLGHARGASIGDSLCRIIDFAGDKATREYYINDAGNQITNLGLSLIARYREQFDLDFEMPEDGYHGQDVIDIASRIKEEVGDKYINNADLEFFKKRGVELELERIKKDLEFFNVSFDVWSSEQAIRNEGVVEKVLAQLETDGFTYNSEDATWLASSKMGDEKDRVLVKSDGSYTYLTPDIAYHQNKMDRGYDTLIDILGADHHGYMARMKAAIEALGYNQDQLNFEIIQMVRLVRGGEEVKMSKRSGNAVTIRDLCEEIGVDTTRYFFAMRSVDTQMDFDLDLATKKSNDNPVYYAQYAHARICSVLEKAEGFGLTEVKEFNTIASEKAFDLLEKVSMFESVVTNAAEKRLPHLITNYIYDLSSALHSYYAAEQILSDDMTYSSERITLLKAVKITLANALNLVGVEAKEKM